MTARVKGGVLSRVIWGIDGLIGARVDVYLVGPRAASMLRRVMRLTLAASIASAAASPLSLTLNPPWGLIPPLSSLLLLAASYILPSAWRLALGRALDRELPALLAYALPYSAGSKYLADILANAPREYFPWFSWEADRLRFLLAMGRDPLTALRELALTTPSRSLREALLDYVYSHEVGSPRSQVTMTLLEKAIGEARGQWRSHVDLGRAAVEALIVALMVSVVLAPLALISGGSALGAVALSLALAPISTISLIATRPALGESEAGLHIFAGGVLVAVASSLLTYAFGALYGGILLAPASAAYEYLYSRYRVREERAVAALREAAVGARYGRLIDEKLSETLPLAPKTMGAVIEALRYAGKIGVGEALAGLLRVIEAAKEAVSSARGAGLTLTGVAVAVPALAIYIVRALTGMGAAVEAFHPEGLEMLGSMILAASPILPLPGTVLWRGRVPSLLPSLFSLTLSYMALTL